jgi:tyrosine-protein kinase Etk/Wzc
MNAPLNLQQLQQAQPGALQSQTLPPAEDDAINLAEYWDILIDNRWLILSILALALAAGFAYSIVARPVYQANLLIQVEDSGGSTKSFLGEASNLFEVKTPAVAEIEIIRSRMIVGQAVDNTALHIDARPRYVPLVGNWMARRAKSLSDPGFMGLKGYVSGTEQIAVEAFKVPPSFEGQSFQVTAQGGNRYTLAHPDIPGVASGMVRTPLTVNTPEGPITLIIAELRGEPGAEFHLRHRSRLDAIVALQSQLRLAEKGRQSGVIDVSMESTDPVQLTVVLNEIGRQYVRQNVERKAAEAQKTLSFLNTQLPQFKKQLDQAEDAYSKYRNQQGTVALDEEARVILNRSADLQAKLLEAQQKRREMEGRFTAEHPVVRTLDAQISAFNREIGMMNARVKTMPAVQQDTIRLERDVKVNNELYQSLRNSALQLQLVREGKVGNVRLIDEAAVPEAPVKPQASLVIGLAGVLGLLGGIMLALARNALFRGIKDPQEIEAQTGLNVYSTIPLSEGQYGLARKMREKSKGVHLLALTQPHDPAIESLRSLRTALQFGMLEAANNRVLITGATPGVGKSFVAANFAALMAAAGKRVLLVDADLRKGYLNQYFGLARGEGLSELVAGSIPASKAVRHQVLPNLDFLPTGQLPPNPAELMQSSAMAQVLQATSPHYDLVIIDTPPVLVAADTAAVAPHVGTLLMVARAELTHLGELHESAKRLAQAGKTINGVLFNAMDLKRRHYGSYGYKYGRYRYRNYSYKPSA